MNEHTPGPWKWWTSNSWKRLKSEADRSQSRNVLEPYLCRDNHPDIAISAEDMALIAAAPELLEALQQCILQFEYLNEKFGETGTGNMVAARARDAIAKAENRS